MWRPMMKLPPATRTIAQRLALHRLGRRRLSRQQQCQPCERRVAKIHAHYSSLVYTPLSVSLVPFSPSTATSIRPHTEARKPL